MTATAAARAGAGERAIRVEGFGFDLAYTALSAWFVAGVYLDGWAHNHLASTLETFFTPWHAVLYSGYGASALFLVGAVALHRRSGANWRAAIPAGYGVALAGAGVFAFGGVGDTMWHTLLGIEVDLEQLLSPTHLVLAIGGSLMLTGPARSIWHRAADGIAARMVTLLAVTLLVSLITFMTQFAHPFVETFPYEFGRTRAGTDLFVMGPDGSGQTRLTTTGRALAGTWSPDGRRIAFASTENERAPRLAVMGVDGSSAPSLLVEGAFPSWSPDGARIAYLVRTEGATDLYVVNADGSGPRRLTSLGSVIPPLVWAPDGRRLAFSADADGNEEVFVVRAEGGDLARLTRDPARDNFPSWSPDGAKIAFASSRDGRAQLYLMNADGTAQTRLRSSRADDFAPAWSPDGSRIAFVSRSRRNSEIFVVNADGSGERNLSRTTAVDELLPRWSPDGTRILYYTRDRAGFNAQVNQALGTLAILLQGALLTGLALFLLRRGALPFGGLTFIFTVNAALVSVLDDQYGLIAVAAVAGVLADLLARRLGPAPERPLAWRTFAAATPALYFALYFAARGIAGDILWSIPLWSGAIVLAGIAGLLLSLLAGSRPTEISPAAG